MNDGTRLIRVVALGVMGGLPAVSKHVTVAVRCLDVVNICIGGTS